MSLLPGGLWTNVTFASADGAMARRGLAVFAQADYLGPGACRAFLKFFLGTSDKLTAKERLKGVADRIGRLPGQELPIARVLHVEHFEEMEVLLVAMEFVDPIQNRVRTRHHDPQLSLRVLRDLDVAKWHRPGRTWFHFDICPKNTGVTSGGRVVLIDLESVYLGSDSQIVVSTAMCKWDRVPIDIKTELSINENRISPHVALRKHSFEVLLVAAECSLGFLPGGQVEQQLIRWVRTSAAHDAVKAFWQTELSQALRSGVSISVEDIADRLEAMLASHPAIEMQQSPPATASSSVPAPQPLSDEKVQPVGRVQPVSLASMNEEGARARAGQLTRAELLGYFARLKDAANGGEEAPDIWHEMVYLQISHLGDMQAAREIAVSGAELHPDDKGLATTAQILKMWSAS